MRLNSWLDDWWFTSLLFFFQALYKLTSFFAHLYSPLLGLQFNTKTCCKYGMCHIYIYIFISFIKINSTLPPPHTSPHSSRWKAGLLLSIMEEQILERFSLWRIGKLYKGCKELYEGYQEIIANFCPNEGDLFEVRQASVFDEIPILLFFGLVMQRVLR